MRASVSWLMNSRRALTACWVMEACPASLVKISPTLLPVSVSARPGHSMSRTIWSLMKVMRLLVSVTRQGVLMECRMPWAKPRRTLSSPTMARMLVESAANSPPKRPSMWAWRSPPATRWVKAWIWRRGRVTLRPMT